MNKSMRLNNLVDFLKEVDIEITSLKLDYDSIIEFYPTTNNKEVFFTMTGYIADSDIDMDDLNFLVRCLTSSDNSVKELLNQLRVMEGLTRGVNNEQRNN